jgi:uncharacterized protein (TIGR02466 family)
MKKPKNTINHYMQKYTEIVSIFPTPVYVTNLGRELSKEELSLINQAERETIEPGNNTISLDTYVLNKKQFASLKEELNLIIQDYFDKIISPANNISPYITQSWFSYLEKNQYFHKHHHANSLVSGVFYVSCNPEFDKIKFYRDGYVAIKPEVKDYNLWNSESWQLPINTGTIILFPSSLTHMVESKKGDGNRISLAFNIFIKGKIGNERRITSLNL